MKLIESHRRAERGDLDGFLRTYPGINPPGEPNQRSAALMLAAADVLFVGGRIDEAERLVSRVMPVVARFAAYESLALAASARIHLARGQIDEAVRLASRAAALPQRGLAALYTLVDVVHVETLLAAKRESEAREALRTSVARLYRRAARLGELGPRFVEHGPHNARLVALARECGVAVPP